MGTKVIKFYADWCGPCKVYAKTFDKVAEELKDKVEFVNVNIETDTTGLAAEYKVKSIPFTVVLQEGKEVKKEVGQLREQALKELILF
jgi:thioredoxin|tara:strand:+ start:790 stop:1053 length:264 start_codon:yes stop_codon:yes gene_type:complete